MRAQIEQLWPLKGSGFKTMRSSLLGVFGVVGFHESHAKYHYPLSIIIIIDTMPKDY